MPRYFTVDRRGSLERNLTIDLIRYDDIHPESLQEHVNFLFNEGVTSHGDYYFLNSRMPATGANPIIELMFEYVRRSYFPNCPSRFQSVFAFGTPEEAEQFKNEYGSEENLIWEVEADQAFNADMRFLSLTGSLLQLSYNSHCYWNGNRSGENCVWELLLTPPVTVIRQI